MRPAALQLHLLGGFSLTFDGEAVPPLPSRHARLLLAWLVLQGGRPQQRTLLADRLWPDVPETRARRRLSHALWQVQDALTAVAPEQPYLLTPGDAVAFNTDAPYWLDVEEFEQRIDEVDAAGSADGAGIRHLRRVVELYHGDLLAGSYESWVLAEQDRLRQRYVSVLVRLVEAAKQRGNYEEALSVARLLTHQAPLREDAHREVMRLCVLLGQTSQALGQFERCRSVLAEELGTEPSAETVALARSIAETRTTEPSQPRRTDQLESDRLVGRDEQRVRLVDQLDRTLAGNAGIVLVEGEQGMGKTHLLAQTASDARWRGFTVLWATPPDTPTPYGPVRAALEPALDAVRVAQLRAHLDEVWVREAARLLPALVLGGVDDAPARGGPPRPGPGQDGAERLREALVRVLTGLADLEPVVVVFEDIHRADAETLALLEALARRAPTGRLLLLCSFRSDDAREDESVWTALRAVDRDGHPVRLTLPALSPFETVQLLREVLAVPQVPASFGHTVHRESGGNPLYTLELLRALRDVGALGETQRDSLDTLRVPVTEGLRSLVEDRLALLSRSTVRVARLGAVLGAEFSLDALRAADPHGADAARAVGELTRRNLVEVEADQCRFVHAATRRVLLDGLPDDEARQLHAAAARALAATAPERHEALAGHLLAAGDHDGAVPQLELAAERALDLHAHAAAAAHLDAAVAAAAVADRPRPERRRLLLRAEATHDVLGHRERQRALLDELATLDPTPAEALDVQLRHATLLGHTDDVAGAVAAARSAVAGTDAGDDRARTHALTTLGQLLGWAGDNDAAVEVLREATRSMPDDADDAVRARVELGTALRFVQRFDEADEVLATALAVAEERHDDIAVVQVLGAVAGLRAETGRMQEAAELYASSVAQARRLGFRHREGVGLVNLGTVRLTQAEPAPALAAYDDAAAVFGELGNRRGLAMVQLNRAWLQHRWLGDDLAARQDVDAARTYFEQIGSRGLLAVCCETSAAITRRSGDLVSAAATLATGAAAATAAHDGRALVQLDRGRLELVLTARHLDRPVPDGLVEDAGALAEDALARASSLGLDEFVADLAGIAALLRLDAEDPAGAQRFARTATAHLDASGDPHRIHHRLGLVAAACGDPAAAAREHLAAAERLERALTGLSTTQRERALSAVREHAAISAAAAQHEPRTVALRMASVDAPRGRPLDETEQVTVRLALEPDVSTVDERRSLLLAVLEQVQEQGAEATVADLTEALDVSASTVRRDLQALRAAGHDARTRGTGTG